MTLETLKVRGAADPTGHPDLGVLAYRTHRLYRLRAARRRFARNRSSSETRSRRLLTERKTSVAIVDKTMVVPITTTVSMRPPRRTIPNLAAVNRVADQKRSSKKSARRIVEGWGDRLPRALWFLRRLVLLLGRRVSRLRPRFPMFCRRLARLLARRYFCRGRFRRNQPSGRGVAQLVERTAPGEAPHYDFPSPTRRFPHPGPASWSGPRRAFCAFSLQSPGGSIGRTPNV